MRGECSTSSLRYGPFDHACSEGRVKSESRRWTWLTIIRACVLRKNSDGKRYNIQSAHGKGRRRVALLHCICDTSLYLARPQHLRVSHFFATFRGHSVPEAPNVDLVLVRQAGFTNADRQMRSVSMKVQCPPEPEIKSDGKYRFHAKCRPRVQSNLGADH